MRSYPHTLARTLTRRATRPFHTCSSVAPSCFPLRATYSHSHCAHSHPHYSHSPAPQLAKTTGASKRRPIGWLQSITTATTLIEHAPESLAPADLKTHLGASCLRALRLKADSRTFW